MSSQKLQAAQWEGSEDGRIFAPGFGDVYATRSGAWGQARAVFIEGCDLPRRWQQGECVRLLETGFGLGVNFLATWAALDAGPEQADDATHATDATDGTDATDAAGSKARPRARLDYVSIEKHPFTRDDLHAALALSIASAPDVQLAPLQRLADRLLAQWPPMIPGFHALELDEHVTLTLVFDDIAEALPRIAGRFDAIYLDGFAPDRNPAMWSAPVLAQVAALAAPGARLSSWCVAGAVRRALADAGFKVGKRPGFGGKRDCLSAQWPLPAKTGQRGTVEASTVDASAADASIADVAPDAEQLHPDQPSHLNTGPLHTDNVAVPAEAIVIGAGVAGASIARQLARRGVRVTVLERDQPACGGSGNPVGVVRPEPGGAGNPITELTAAGVTWLKRWLDRHGEQVPHDWCGVLRIARDERKREKMSLQAGATDPDWLQAVDLEEAAHLCGVGPTESGFHLPLAGWLVPPALVSSLLDHPGIEIRRAEVSDLRKDGDVWQLTLADGSRLQSPLVVLATAFDQGLGATRLSMGRARGQLSMLPEREGRVLRKIVCRDGYITPAVNGWHVVGATVQHDDDDGTSRRSDDVQNYERLQRLLPGFANGAAELLGGRVGWRSTTPDRLPLVGKVEPGLYATLGHGARGVTCAPLCAEFLAAMICNEPLPLGVAWIARLDPRRRLSKVG